MAGYIRRDLRINFSDKLERRYHLVVWWSEYLTLVKMARRGEPGFTGKLMSLVAKVLIAGLEQSEKPWHGLQG